MDTLWNELVAGVPDLPQAIRVVTRITLATVLGAVIGYEREQTGTAAGLRTHMLVALSCAIFVVAPSEDGMSASDLSRILQGVVAGIGFIGAGTILKNSDERQVEGLTTAAGIWLTAAVGIAAGLGRLGLAISVFLAWIILALATRQATR